jgi:hypothetical protein
MEATDWHPVTSRDGAVLGWMAAPDPDEPDVGYFEADRTRKVGLRAARLEEAVALFSDDAFDPETVWDTGLASGLTDEDLDAAANVAVLLWRVEHGG